MSNVSTQQESQASNPINTESNWKQEFEELDARFRGMFTVGEAKEHAKNELTKHDQIIKPIENRLKEARDILADSSAAFFSVSDKRAIGRTIESLEFDLGQAKKLREQSILKCGGLIKSVKEWEPKRKRWLELRKRSQDIERAKDMASGKNGQELPMNQSRRWIG